jgi:uncharacterized membrane protein
LVEGWGYADVEMISHQTLYTAIGNSFVYGCILLTLFALGLSIINQKRSTMTEKRRILPS